MKPVIITFRRKLIRVYELNWTVSMQSGSELNLIYVKKVFRNNSNKKENQNVVQKKFLIIILVFYGKLEACELATVDD